MGPHLVYPVPAFGHAPGSTGYRGAADLESLHQPHYLISGSHHCSLVHVTMTVGRLSKVNGNEEALLHPGQFAHCRLLVI
jgi:hypothetical protein